MIAFLSTLPLDVSQVLVVRPTGGWHATVEAFERTDIWRLRGRSMEATIGERGFAEPGQKREGDLKSPSGLYCIDYAFGSAGTYDTSTLR